MITNLNVRSEELIQILENDQMLQGVMTLCKQMAMETVKPTSSVKQI